MRLKAITIFLILTLCSVCVHAEPLSLTELALIGQKCSGVDYKLILSVLLAESNGNPYCVNDNSKKISKCFKNRTEAYNYIINKRLSINTDIGLMQVNYKSWANVFGLSAYQLLEPKVNVCVGSMILGYFLSHNEAKDWNGWRGVGFYNTGTKGSKRIQVIYAQKVYDRYKKILQIINE